MVVTGFHTPNSSASRAILTVSQLTSLVRTSIETQFQDIWLEGEISNFRTPGSGHLYFTLKDETCQIRAVLFRSSATRLRFVLQEGMNVVVRGRLTVYEPRGEYQIVLDVVEPKGIGALQLAFEQLKERLAAEGLFDLARKKPLPLFPKTVGVVTSLSGAAVKDILAVLRRRWPTLHIIIVPVQVQGAGSRDQIAGALRSLNEHGRADVIIVGRGGGTLEDLWSFNEEVVVRAVAASRIPIVSAVGHEIDMTLTDFAADLRAPTPSVAAEMVVPVLADVLEQLHDLTRRAGRAMARHCLSEYRRLESTRRGLTHIRFRIQEESQRTDEMAGRLRDTTFSRLSIESDRVRLRERALVGLSPLWAVKRSLAMIPLLLKRLIRQVRVLAMQRHHQVEAAVARLNGLSPLAVLGRGYSILMRSPGGNVLKRVRDVKAGDGVTARLADGRLDCTVRRVVADPSV
jgi:exodeoxyribonuclease VII large subunit